MNQFLKHRNLLLYWTIFFLFICSSASSQILPSFSVSKKEGCMPLLVEFSNTTVLDTSKVQIRWDFGNGNQSVEKLKTQAAYNNPGVFNITMTVKMNGIDYKTTETVTVFDNPQPAFEADIFSGCVPLKVNFKDLSIPTQNPIITWVWNFGDGVGSTLQNPTNTFNSESKNNVTLLLVDSKGCKNIIVKNNFITSTEKPEVDFTYSDTVTCKLPLNVKFNGSVKSNFSTTYNWDFGNGFTSNNLQPTSKFTESKTYPITFIATNSFGCKNQITKSISIKEEPFNFKIVSPNNKGCAPFKYQFKATSDRVISQYKWSVDTFASSKDTGSIIFNTPGKYIMKLVASDNFGCSNTIYDTVVVYEKPKANFSFDKKSACAGPLEVSFTSLTPDAVTHSWAFSNGISPSIEENPSRIFNKEASYNIRYTVSNEFGCLDTLLINGAIIIRKPIVEIIATNDMGCAPYSSTLSITKDGDGSIDNIKWNYSDGTQYAGFNPPSVEMSQEGTFLVTAEIDFEGNCPSQIVTKKLVAGKLSSFTAKITPNKVCVREGVGANITKSSSGTFYTWHFGDGGTREGENVTYEYSDPGKFDVYVVAEKNGCKDSVYIETIEVLNPAANFSISKTCNSFEMVFRNRSIGQNYSRWDFGDGTQLISDASSINHVFKDTGTYQVKLYVENYTTLCKDSLIREVIITNQQEDLGLLPQIGCLPYTAEFIINNSLFKNIQWNFNGTLIDGKNGRFTYSNPGQFDVSVDATINGCRQTFKFPKIVTVVDYQADFEFTPAGGCAPIQVDFKDITQSEFSEIASLRWRLGDQGSSTLSEPQATFNQNKNQVIRLITLDNTGCRDTVEKTVPIFTPKADFTSEYKSVCTDVNFNFENTSTGVELKYKWTFGDQLGASDEQNPIRTFNKEGNYDVKLVVTDANNCKDSISKSSFVKVENFKYDFVGFPRFKTCPELVSNFEVIPSNIFYKRVFWNFGDGNNSLDTNRFPTNIYSESGVFDVSLVVEDFRGCKDTITKENYIEIKGPRGKMTFDPQEGCYPIQINFEAEFVDSKFNIWDFGDGIGRIDASLQTKVDHVYNNPGLAIPSLILDDGLGCVVHLYHDTLNISGTKIKIDLSDKGICSGSEVTLTDISEDNINSPIVFREWKFSNGIISNEKVITQSFNVDSTQIIYAKLSIGTELGCKNSDSIPIKIFAYPQLILDDEKVICKGDGVVLTAKGSEFFDWSPKSLVAPSNISSPKVSPLKDSWFYVTGYDTILCPVNDSIFVKVNNSFFADAGPDTTLCLGDSLLLNTSVSVINSGEFEYSWSLNNKVIGKEDSLFVFPDKESTYVVHIRNGSCKEYSLPIFINVSPRPEVEAFQDSKIANGQNIVLKATADQNVTYSWTPDYNISCLTCFNPNVFPNVSTQYKVIGTNEFGCSANAKVSVEVVDYCSGASIEIPNVFSPNFDGKNDIFRLKYDKDLLSINVFRIYNRYGEVIFETSNPDEGWDGTFNQTPINTGVYVYYVELDCYDGGTNFLKGNITLLR
ncbi:MAG TPA: PKD domain-containing protein [Chitinophagales bacterium]|nr:PKD domain-containing protein [Chitinophagales bacterium]